MFVFYLISSSFFLSILHLQMKNIYYPIRRQQQKEKQQKIEFRYAVPRVWVFIDFGISILYLINFCFTFFPLLVSSPTQPVLLGWILGRISYIKVFDFKFFFLSGFFRFVIFRVSSNLSIMSFFCFHFSYLILDLSTWLGFWFICSCFSIINILIIKPPTSRVSTD